jgi:glutamate racemase
MDQSIGIFDSGLGGLTVMQAVSKLLPCESIVYLGDTARVPYGSKSSETIIKYSLENCRFLIDRGVKAIVVACNSSSAHAMTAIRNEFEIPVIGVVEPGVSAAITSKKCNRIGVIGTQATISSDVYARALKIFHPNAHVVSLACPLFVPLVEEGLLDGDVADAIIQHYLVPLKAENIESLILGCTHYPMLKPIINRFFDDQLTLIDSGESAAHTLKDLLTKKGILSTVPSEKNQCFVTDIPNRFEAIASRFLGDSLPSVSQINL